MQGKIRIPVASTPELKAEHMELRPTGFLPHNGPKYVVTFYGKSGRPIACENWEMKKEDWQAWPAYDTEEEDTDYLLSRVIFDMGITLDLQEPIELKNEKN